MKITHQIITRCIVFMTFGAAAMLPMASAQESNLGLQPSALESRAAAKESGEKKPEPEANPIENRAEQETQNDEVEYSFVMEGPVYASGRPEDLNIKPGLEPHEQDLKFTGRITCSSEACKHDHHNTPQADPSEARAAVKEAAERKKEPQAKAPTSLNPEFAADLYQQLRKTEGNVFFSPCSITQAMGMAYLGAKGDTAAEFKKALSLDGAQKDFAQHMQQLRKVQQVLANRDEDKLSIANALCVTGMVPLQDYQTMIQEKFDGELFAGGIEKINEWASKKTDGNIERILEELDPNSACVLLNAVYFKGTWQNAFEPKATHERDFHVSSSQSVKVPMMARKGNYALTVNGKYIAVELPYKTSCSMVLVMPTKADGFEEFEAGVNEAFLDQVCSGLKGAKQKIALSIPKFKIKTGYNLVPPMKQLGMAKAFEPRKADFTAMYDSRDIFISQIKHKATLEVDEKGSVATATTAIGMLSFSMPMPPELKITFDRPFLVMIRENTTNSTLFMGRISDPTK